MDTSAATGDNVATETRAVPLSKLEELVHDSLLGLTYSKSEAEVIGNVSIAFAIALTFHFPLALTIMVGPSMLYFMLQRGDQH